MALELVKLTKGSSSVSRVGSLGFFKLSADTGGGGGDLTFSRVFSENTPEQISAVSAVISANNMTSAQVAETFGWNLGDTIDITLTTSEAIQMRIIGFNHDDKSDGSGKAGITLEMVGCLTSVYWHNSATCINGYSGSRYKTGVMVEYKELLSEEWQTVIIPINKISSKAYSSTEVVTTTEELFPLSEIELLGTSSLAQNGEKEGVQYEYWVGKSNADRIKRYHYTETNIWDVAWWTRSMSNYGTKYTVYVNDTGGFSRQAPNKASTYVSFAFCV